MQPKISVIVPVYNAETYIHHCIDSILAQTFTDFELILVNDGSPDCSGTICDEYAHKDSRIKVFHKKNGGVSSARNMGLNKATGIWITFIDSDDYIEPGFLEGLYKPVAEGEEVDFVHGGCLNMIDNQVVSVNQSYDYHIGCEPDILYLKLRGLIVSKLFKTDILEKTGLCFDEKMKIAEDMAFTLDYALQVKRYVFVPEKGYHYRKDNSSSATHNNQFQNYDTQLHSFYHIHESITNYINKNQLDNNVAKLRLGYEAIQLQNVCMALYHDKYIKNERLKHLKNDFQNEHIELLKLAKQDKIKAIIFSLLKRKRYILFDFFMKIYIDLKELKRNLS